jgi:putative ABC transport system substrate-binding protein
MPRYRVHGHALGALVGLAGGLRGRSLLLATLVLALLAVPLAAAAQQPPKVPRTGYLAASSPSAGAPLLEAFRQGLRELGYVEGQNISIECVSTSLQ